jgi:tRNA modification GTPase
MDTIFALASARGRAGVSVIRISGDQAYVAAEKLCGPLPEPRRAALRVLRFGGDVLDEALVLRFEAGTSFTNEDIVEFHVHGGVATVAAILRILGSITGLRVAEPGEFSRRALESGRMDLTQIEGLADLIDAETEAQRRQAVALLSGALGKRADGWRLKLIRAMSLLEATIDFSEEDVPESVAVEVQGLLTSVRAEILAELSGAKSAERIRDGFEIAIIGAPNVGKSTLLNALAGREAAITSEIAGTTRDVIEVRMEISGLAVTLLDTAGLRDTTDAIEGRGIELALSRARNADLRLFLKEGAEQLPLAPHDDDIVVMAKADLKPQGQNGVSGLTGEGLDALISKIGQILEAKTAGSSLIIRERQRRGLETAISALDRALELVVEEGVAELAAEDLRNAVAALASLVGRVGVEDLLEEIFSRFCIGK